jgi:hypothetical protein
MDKRPTYSLVFTPGQHQIRFTLIESVWHPRNGLVPHYLESVWTPWDDWQRNGRRLMLRAVVLSSAQLPPPLPLRNDTPKASASPGGS